MGNKYNERPKGIKHCIKCGKALTSKQRGSRQQYCSRGCYIKKPIPVCICNNCGKEFKPTHNDRLKYCSRECAFQDSKAWRHSKPKKIKTSCKMNLLHCEYCGVDFVHRYKTKKYCSDDCARSEHNKRERDKYRIKSGLKNVSRVCRCCGKEFKTFKSSQKYCSGNCSKKYHHKLSKQRRRVLEKEKFVEYVSLEYLFFRDQGRCQLCGRKLNLKRKVPHLLAITMDHIIPLSKGGEHSKKNTQLACFGCNSNKGNRINKNGEQLLLFG